MRALSEFFFHSQPLKHPLAEHGLVPAVIIIVGREIYIYIYIYMFIYLSSSHLISSIRPLILPPLSWKERLNT